MKKILLSLALFAASIGAWATDVVTAKVSGSNLNIALTNETSYCAFQMDIQLPDGVSASTVSAVANRLSQEGSDSEIGGTKFIVASNVLEGNVLRVIAYNLANAAISGASGDDILTIALEGTVSDPTAITVTNILFVTSGDNLAESAFADVTGESGAIKGDVDSNTKVNISDVVEVIKVIKAAGFSANADVDGDGKVNISDVVEIIKIIKQ